jgi:diguanylate cyclase (GGDEF)-like protein
MLKNLATRLQSLVREGELLARYGGEEFALVLSKATVEGAEARAERFRLAVDGHPFEFEGQTCLLTVSAGVGFLPAGAMFTASDLFCQADEGLYNAKQAGRNRVAPIALVCQPSNRPIRPITRAFLRSGE